MTLSRDLDFYIGRVAFLAFSLSHPISLPQAALLAVLALKSSPGPAAVVALLFPLTAAASHALRARFDGAHPSLPTPLVPAEMVARATADARRADGGGDGGGDSGGGGGCLDDGDGGVAAAFLPPSLRPPAGAFADAVASLLHAGGGGGRVSVSQSGGGAANGGGAGAAPAAQRVSASRWRGGAGDAGGGDEAGAAPASRRVRRLMVLREAKDGARKQKE